MLLRTLPPAALLAALTAALLTAQPKPPDGDYVKKATRADTVAATLASHKLPNLGGKWYFVGPFDNPDKTGFDREFGPEKGAVDLTAKYPGKGGKHAVWAEFKGFRLGQVLDLAALFPQEHKNNSVVYLYHEFDSDREFRLPLSLGSDDTLSVYFNGRRLLHEPHERAAAPDQDRVELPVVAGKNRLLIKIAQHAGGWEAYVAPELPLVVPETIRRRVTRDFPASGEVQAAQAAAGAEATHYAVSTLPLPDDCVLEVGGLAFRPDGKLLACTRRGEVWLVHNPLEADPRNVKVTRFATGLHEALGMWVQDDKTVFVVHRPEVCKLTDSDGDGVADAVETVCDKWGVSGDYHEYAFGPARDRDGNFYVTLNVGFGGGHQAKAPWRGWCVKINPRTGSMEPWAYGLRSPNGVNFSPDGDLFYADNQGEWVATNKLHHIQRGKFFGHQAGLRWLPFSPFAGLVPEKVASGMMYDGQKGPGANAPAGMPQLDPPAIWFPYGRMGRSLSEPIWDTTRGKFGPFAGQCFVGDQSTSVVMRVALEKVNGVFQGACFPFRAGFQSGVNRLAFAPDGSLLVGETNRGWGSAGGRPFGLQRVTFTGTEPAEIHHVALTKTGFDLTFTKPVDVKSAEAAVPVESYTYIYSSAYGCPETDRRAEAVASARLSADGRTLSLDVPGVRPGRVYALRPESIRTRTGERLVHPEAYYTVNQTVR
ncbi:DUF7133 domain-containing protein [Urbifossiella limnaea]|uniref:SMP-30/Gluconolaconase/LRE-like region n=1 Tax=Urbifossiella limnaea TaxID=2528023 RepID=A0A517XTH5_9BACT|nr:hypothetical protein [Urbifossiella limnaea]QDU20826.1 SMP-30/Gluconolaconase/LRE-like region [Urbifossiella limnaea]